MPIVKPRITGSANGSSTPTVIHRIDIPQICYHEIKITIAGSNPLLVNNKMNVAQEISDQYSGAGKAGAVKKIYASDDEKYVKAFYVMPDSKFQPPNPKADYGVPTSGIKKCVCKAIRTTGITDNTTIGLIANSFWISADGGGLCKLRFKRLERDIRPVNVGSGTKTVPQMRHRPMFHEWEIDVRVSYNAKILTKEQLVNLFMHAGAYIGLCEMRAEKRQGECGSFIILPGNHMNEE